MPSSKRVFLGNHIFEVTEKVYEPAEDSFLFAENLDDAKNKKVLDIGTGCGILAISVAEDAKSVCCIDINPFAIRCAKQNAKLNSLDAKMFFLQGDLFSALNRKIKFDLILFNSPYLPSHEEEGNIWIERAWSGGEKGREVIDRFINQVCSHIKNEGSLLLMQSNLSNIDATILELSKIFKKVQVDAKLSLPFFEELVLIRATRLINQHS